MSGEAAQGTALGVGDCHDALGGNFLAYLLLKHVLEETEGDCRLGGGSRLRDYHDAEAFAFKKFHQVIEIILADVVAGKYHFGAVILLESGEVVAQSLDNGFGAKIAAANADYHYVVTLLAQLLCSGVDVIEFGSCYLTRQV